jgi:alpha-glucosidase
MVKNLQGAFAKYPTVETTGGYANMNYVVNGRADYIAKTKGARSFPVAGGYYQYRR